MQQNPDVSDEMRKKISAILSDMIKAKIGVESTEEVKELDMTKLDLQSIVAECLIHPDIIKMKAEMDSKKDKS